MAEEHGSGKVPETVTFVVGLLIVLFVLWVAQGGPQKAAKNGGLFINPLPPLGNGQTYGPGSSTTTPPAQPSYYSY